MRIKTALWIMGSRVLSSSLFGRELNTSCIKGIYYKMTYIKGQIGKIVLRFFYKDDIV